mgnify:CR=1 FL=1
MASRSARPNYDDWQLGVPERIFSEGEDKWRDNPDRMRLRELLHFECVDWTLFGTCLYGVDKQPDTTGPAPEVDDELSSRLSAHFARTRATTPDADGWIAWDPHAGITEAPERATYAKQRGGRVCQAREIGTWGEFRSGQFEVIAYRTTPLTAAKK